MSAAGRLAWIGASLAIAVATPGASYGQTETSGRRIFGVEATPVGALPPLALPMPASRNHNYLAVRAQIGRRESREGGADLLAMAGGVDLQWRGGSIFGVTAGYQDRDCEPGDAPCEGHAFYGARARFNVFTGGPTVANLFGDYSATTTLGAEIGVGYAPDAAPGYDPCTLDVGMPVSVAMLQTVRLLAFVMPTAAIDMNCGGGTDRHRDLILNAGIGVQQVLYRGLDVYLGVQRVVRDDTGYQFGISVMYVHLP